MDEPRTLCKTAFTNALQASGQFRPGGKYVGRRRESKVAAGIDGTIDPEKGLRILQGYGS